ncbi:MAG: FAD/NAD(P)-binding protein [Pseudomonadota bacterium]
MHRPRICIIGMGPRGLSVLERIAAFARVHRASLELLLVDPAECGPGVHSPRQPAHLLINTVASQVTVFPSAGTVDHMPSCATPSLTEWARAQGYRRFGERFLQVGADGGGTEIGEADYLPRQLLGHYLAWACAQLRASLPAGVSVQHLRQRAHDMQAAGDGWAIELGNGYVLRSDYVFLTTGHSRSMLSDEEAWYRKFALDHARYNSRLAYVRHCYPLEQLTAIGSDATVAICGIGLTAHDVLAQFTEGRGGRYERVDGSLRYIASGEEPRLLLYSRNCLPALARAINQKGLSGRHQARFFTRDAVRALRERRRGGQLDFERELLPLMKKEMAYAWRSAFDGAASDPHTYTPGEDEQDAIEQLLTPGRISGSQAFRAVLAADLREANRGNLTSPVKAAADVLRDVRAVLQEMIEHGGLLPASHRKFFSVHNPIINRITFGPPRLRNEQLLALMDAGLLGTAAGPNAMLRIDEERSRFALHANGAIDHADVVVVARLDPYSPITDDTALTRQLLARGIIRPYFNGNFHPGGIDIDRANHPLDRQGQAQASLWALCYPVEGAHYYTHALPRPGLPSRQVSDADRCVNELFLQLTGGRPATPETDEVLKTETFQAG